MCLSEVLLVPFQDSLLCKHPPSLPVWSEWGVGIWQEATEAPLAHGRDLAALLNGADALGNRGGKRYQEDHKTKQKTYY